MLILILSVTLGDLVAIIPMAALVAVIIVTVIGTVATENLAVGVTLGVLTAMVLFAQRVSPFVTVKRNVTGEGDDATAHYTVVGELFWASSNHLYTLFDYANDPEHIVIDFSQSHLWDASTIAALDSIEDKYQHYGKTIEISGLNVASRAMRARMSGRLN